MKNDTSENKKLTKLVVKTVLKTLGIIFFMFGFVIVSLSVVAPQFTMQTFDVVGFDKASYLVHKRLYLRDPSMENLYNLIQKSIDQGNYKDQAKYIKLMIEDENFSKFANKVDVGTQKALGERYSVYADSYDSYLRRHLVVAVYKSGRQLEAKMMAIDSVYGGLDELSSYVNLVINDDGLTDFQKEVEIKTLYSRYSLVEALDTKLLELEELLSLSDSAYNSIIVLEQKIKLAEIQAVIGEFAGDNSLTERAKENKGLWSTEIKTLMESLES